MISIFYFYRFFIKKFTVISTGQTIEPEPEHSNLVVILSLLFSDVSCFRNKNPKNKTKSQILLEK